MKISYIRFLVTVMVAPAAFVADVRGAGDQFQPDAQIGRNVGNFIGNDIYDGSGPQNLNLSSRRRPGIFFVRVQNDSPDVALDSFLIQGKRNPRFWKITFSEGGANVTAEVLSGLHSTGNISGGQNSPVLKGVVKPKRAAKKRRGSKVRGSCPVTATSTGDSLKTDTVKMRFLYKK